MPILGGAGIASTVTGIAERTGVTGAAEDAISSVGNTIGIGGNEQVQALPEGVPQEPVGPQVGTAHNGPPGAPDHSETIALRRGLYNYDDLSAAGLHDAISHAEINAPVRVIFYEGVEGGQPAGRSFSVQGPTTVTIDQFRSNGLENEVSSIAVVDPDWNRQGTNGSGSSSGGAQNGSSGDGDSTGGNGSTGSAGQTPLLIGLGIIGLLIWQAQ